MQHHFSHVPPMTMPPPILLSHLPPQIPQQMMQATPPPFYIQTSHVQTGSHLPQPPPPTISVSYLPSATSLYTSMLQPLSIQLLSSFPHPSSSHQIQAPSTATFGLAHSFPPLPMFHLTQSPPHFPICLIHVVVPAPTQSSLYEFSAQCERLLPGSTGGVEPMENGERCTAWDYDGNLIEAHWFGTPADMSHMYNSQDVAAEMPQPQPLQPPQSHSMLEVERSPAFFAPRQRAREMAPAFASTRPRSREEETRAFFAPRDRGREVAPAHAPLRVLDRSSQRTKRFQAEVRRLGAGDSNFADHVPYKPELRPDRKTRRVLQWQRDVVKSIKSRADISKNENHEYSNGSDSSITRDGRLRLVNARSLNRPHSYDGRHERRKDKNIEYYLERPLKTRDDYVQNNSRAITRRNYAHSDRVVHETGNEDSDSQSELSVYSATVAFNKLNIRSYRPDQPVSTRRYSDTGRIRRSDNKHDTFRKGGRGDSGKDRIAGLIGNERNRVEVEQDTAVMPRSRREKDYRQSNRQKDKGKEVLKGSRTKYQRFPTESSSDSEDSCSKTISSESEHFNRQENSRGVRERRESRGDIVREGERRYSSIQKAKNSESAKQNLVIRAPSPPCPLPLRNRMESIYDESDESDDLDNYGSLPYDHVPTHKTRYRDHQISSHPSPRHRSQRDLQRTGDTNVYNLNKRRNEAPVSSRGLRDAKSNSIAPSDSASMMKFNQERERQMKRGHRSRY